MSWKNVSFLFFQFLICHPLVLYTPPCTVHTSVYCTHTRVLYTPPCVLFIFFILKGNMSSFIATLAFSIEKMDWVDSVGLFSSYSRFFIFTFFNRACKLHSRGGGRGPCVLAYIYFFTPWCLRKPGGVIV